MKTTIIKQFGSGQITIPKKWRDESKASAYRASKNGTKIILSPIKENDDEVEFYEDKNGFGLIFKKGISPEVLLKKFRAAEALLKKKRDAKVA
ncbi:MAG: hypothetical protein ABIH35_04670 [Patescibacteria group bacterium]